MYGLRKYEDYYINHDDDNLCYIKIFEKGCAGY